jgi:hypothetical protein
VCPEFRPQLKPFCRSPSFSSAAHVLAVILIRCRGHPESSIFASLARVFTAALTLYHSAHIHAPSSAPFLAPLSPSRAPCPSHRCHPAVLYFDAHAVPIFEPSSTTRRPRAEADAESFSRSVHPTGAGLLRQFSGPNNPCTSFALFNCCSPSRPSSPMTHGLAPHRRTSPHATRRCGMAPCYEPLPSPAPKMRSPDRRHARGPAAPLPLATATATQQGCQRIPRFACGLPSPARAGLARCGLGEQCTFSFSRALVQIKFKWDLNFSKS